MSLETLANLGEFVGAIGVLITLVFFVRQLAQNSRMIEANTQAVVGASEREAHNQTAIMQLAAAGNGELAGILLRGFKGESLTPEEHVQFNNFVYASFQMQQAYFVQWRRGLMGDDIWHFYAAYWSDQVLKFSGVEKWWGRNAKVFIPEFRRYVNHLMEQHHGATPESGAAPVLPTRTS